MTRWRPVAHVALRDDALRAAVVAALHDAGWAVVEARTGYHLVRALSGLILGDKPWLQVGMVVVDDALPGCRGSAIARGLRELAIDVPLAIIAPAGDPEIARLDDPDRRVHVLDPALATIGVTAIARASVVDDDGALEAADRDDAGAAVGDRGARGALELVGGRRP
jgi:hypothetical protein